MGLENYADLLRDKTFHKVLWNTIYYAIFHIPLTLAASLGLALLLNRKMRGVQFFRTVAFFPYITSIVAIAAVWNMLFSAIGPISNSSCGWATDPGWTSRPRGRCVIIVGTWRYGLHCCSRGAQAIPEICEAARGWLRRRRFWNVTLGPAPDLLRHRDVDVEFQDLDQSS